MRVDAEHLQAVARSGADTPEARREAAGAMEAYLLRQMLAEVRSSSSPGMLDGGFAGATFQEMLDGALADSMAAAGGMGLGPTIARSLDRGAPSHKAAPPPASPAVMPRVDGEPISLRAPIAGPITSTSSFGPRRDPIEGDRRWHAGIDLRAPAGAPVQAAAGGTVTHAGPAGSYGNLVVVDHGGGVETRYAHLESVDARVGERVPAGGAVGRVGSTGRATGPHLHFELRRNGKAIDPAQLSNALKNPQERSNR